MDIIEKKISGLIESQFPAFYREEGPVFIQFVTEYYKWMETVTASKKRYTKSTKQTVNVTLNSANVIGSNTKFTERFSNGDQIAIYRESNVDDNNYIIFTIDSIANNTFLTLTSDKLPSFSSANANIDQVIDRANPLYYSRHFFEVKDIDETFDEFIVYFKEKYLKNIQFDTVTGARTLVKNSLDLYRSKGTERSLDLLFRIAFGVGADVYYPSSDLFSPSSGQWYVPQYLELSLNDKSANLVNKQIKGIKSGATAFCESLIRRSVGSKLLDVAFISAINGNFETGEKINSFDDILTIEEAPFITGSLNELSIDVNGIGENFSIGDVLDLTSQFGIQGRARVVSTSNNAGVIELSLSDGGYAYTENSEVIISEKVLTFSNVEVSATANQYFDFRENIYQNSANINYIAATGSFANGDEVFTYHANNDLKGSARILVVTPINATAGEMSISILSGNMDSSALYTTSNTISAGYNLSNGYFDTSTTANVVGEVANVNLFVQDVSGTFVNGEEIFQLNATTGGEFANATFNGLFNPIGSNGEIRTNTSFGAFRNNVQIEGRDSGATANVYSVKVVVGVKDIDGTFITTTNNYVYGNTLSTNATIISMSNGSGVDFAISNSFLYEEYIDLNTDFIKDYTHLPLEQAFLTGNVSVNTTSTDVIGNGTDFTGELEDTLSGEVITTSGSKLVTGNGSSFSSELSIGDFIRIDVGTGIITRKVASIANDTLLTVNSNISTACTSATYTKNMIVRFEPNSSFAEAKSIESVSNSINMEVDSTFSFTDSNSFITLSWGFPGNTAANLSYATIQDTLSYQNTKIGKIQSLISINRGTGYNQVPVIRVFEPLTYSYRENELETLIYTGSTSSFNVGELVTQESTGARGLIQSSNATHLVVQRLKLFDSNNFIITSNTTTKIVGSDGGATANVTLVNVDTKSDYLGLNAKFNKDLNISNGAITSVEVTDSGFGFVNSESVTMTSGNNSTSSLAVLNTHGTGRGFYLDRGGFSSDIKKIFDGYYWQNYSYEVRSSVTLDKYTDMLKNVVHTAGLIYFGNLVYDSTTSFIPSSSTTVANNLYEGYFPIHDYEEELLFYKEFKLFPFGYDLNNSAPPYQFDANVDYPETITYFPFSIDWNDYKRTYLNKLLFPTHDLNDDTYDYEYDCQTQLPHPGIDIQTVDLEKEDSINLIYDMELYGESIDLEQDNLEHFRQDNINTTDIDFEVNYDINIIYDMELYNETVDLNDTLRRI